MAVKAKLSASDINRLFASITSFKRLLRNYSVHPKGKEIPVLAGPSSSFFKYRAEPGLCNSTTDDRWRLGGDQVVGPLPTATRLADRSPGSIPPDQRHASGSMQTKLRVFLSCVAVRAGVYRGLGADTVVPTTFTEYTECHSASTVALEHTVTRGSRVVTQA